MEKTHEHQDDLRKFNQMLESAQEANEGLANEVLMLRQHIAILEAQKTQWENSKVLQEQIIQNALNQANFTSNAYLEQIETLKAQIRGYQEELKELKSAK